MLNKFLFPAFATVLSFLIHSSSYCGVPCNDNSDCGIGEVCEHGICKDKKQSVPESSMLVGILSIGVFGTFLFFRNKFIK